MVPFSVVISSLGTPYFFMADHISGAWFHIRLAMTVGV